MPIGTGSPDRRCCTPPPILMCKGAPGVSAANRVRTYRPKSAMKLAG
jgi:hypothetical protein